MRGEGSSGEFAKNWAPASAETSSVASKVSGTTKRRGAGGKPPSSPDKISSSCFLMEGVLPQGDALPNHLSYSSPLL
ncbi:UNVERIFIED_CONTAM: hypothetical protein Sangu_2980700 [Sesamum angustifolium]|uniref:Uncharacterized protein n=1 Tax=Sesamum angustifolium TaxID=2727405 RepID=A0AAW2III2_9LAMI